MALKSERIQPEGMNVRMSGGQPSYSHVVTVSGTGKIVYTAGQLARDIRGIGFRTADQIAGKLGIEKTALIRVRAGIAHALTEAMDEGHCGLPAEELISLTQTLLQVPAELVETALGHELEEGTVIADDLEGRRCVFLAGLYRAEREIAEKLKALAIGRPPWPVIDADRAIPWVEQRTKLVLADSQRETVSV